MEEGRKKWKFYLINTPGGAGGIRTRYLLTASQTFSQLNYSPINIISTLSNLAENNTEGKWNRFDNNCQLWSNRLKYKLKLAGDISMKHIGLSQIVGIVLIGVTLFATSCGGPPAKPKTYSEPPPMLIDTNKQYTATIKTERGNLVLELFASDVPVTVNNFVFLARDGFYDGSTFHRVIPGFMAQGGDPTGTGRGNPGYSFADEFSQHAHGTGTLSMANAGPNTNGSQFFITYAPQPGLDGKHSVFGQLIEGMDVLEKIKPGDTIKQIIIKEEG